MQSLALNDVNCIFSVNRDGTNKDWDYEKLTTGFRDQVGTIQDLKAAIAAGYAITGAHFKGQRRKTANVAQVGLLLIDIDNGMTLDQAKADPFVSQYCALAYTTASHTADHHKFRLIFPLPEAMGRDDFEALAKIVMGKFPADPSCKDAGRAFYGNTQADFFMENHGANLPMEWIKEAIANAQAEREKLEQQKRERQAWLKSHRPFITDAIPLLACCAKEARQLVQDGVPAGSGHNDLALKVLPELIGVERYLISIGQPTQETARQVYDDFLLSSGVSDRRSEQRWEWAESKDWLPSLSPDKIENCIKWAKFKQLPRQEQQRFKRENNFYPERDRALEDLKQDGNLGDQLSQLLPSLKDNRPGTFLAAIALAGNFDDPIGELSQWIKTFNSLDKHKVWPAIELVAAVCADYGDKAINDLLADEIKANTRLSQIRPIRAVFHAVKQEIYPPKNERRAKLDYIQERVTGLRFNELTGKVEKDGEEFKDIDYAYLFPELIDCPLEISKQFAVDGIVWTAKKDSYHPVKEYLDGLESAPILSDDEWDNLACILLGTDPGDELSNIILKKALIAAIARIYRPGCYVRLVAVLQGAQNAGKSSFLRLLAGEDFFCDSLGKLDNPKDDLLLLHGHWLHEWSEIDKLTKKSAGDVKAFITKTKDDFRSPYAKAPESHLRQCVIFGTCNRTDFLQDATGNTRYGVISVGNIDLERVKEWRDRIWATAKVKFEAGEGWELTQAEQALSEINNQSYADVDPWLETIGQFVEYRGVISVNEILENLEIEPGKRDKLAAKRVRDCLTILGWNQDKNATYEGETKKVRRWRPSLAQHGTVNGTVISRSVPECAKSVPEQSLIQQDFEGFGTVGTVKNTKKNIQEHTQLDTAPAHCEISGNENMESQCAKCAKEPETLTQSMAQSGTVNGTVSVPEPQGYEWNYVMAEIDKEMGRLGWGVEDGKAHLKRVYGVRSRHLLKDEQVIEFWNFLQSQQANSSQEAGRA